MKITTYLYSYILAAVLISAGLIAFYEVKPLQEAELEQISKAQQPQLATGESLKNMVAQPGGIYTEALPKEKLSPEAKKLIGRYALRLSCRDPIALCKEGSADYIVTLLDNGQVRRTIIYLGSVSPIEDRQYRQDRWSYNDTTREVTIHLSEGAKFLMQVNAQDNLVMDIDKLLQLSPENRAFFTKNPIPLYAYELKKAHH